MFARPQPTRSAILSMAAVGSQQARPIGNALSEETGEDKIQICDRRRNIVVSRVFVILHQHAADPVRNSFVDPRGCAIVARIDRHAFSSRGIPDFERNTQISKFVGCHGIHLERLPPSSQTGMREAPNSTDLDEAMEGRKSKQFDRSDECNEQQISYRMEFNFATITSSACMGKE